MRWWLSVACGVSVLLFWASSPFAKDPIDAKISPDVAFKRLSDGNARFVVDRGGSREPFYVQRAKLADGQRPFAVILACADSRVSPELVFNQQLGDVFVVRIAGNVVTPEILGSIEYAVEHLGPTLVVVMGHSKCGAVTAVLSGERFEGNLGALAERVAVGSNLPQDKAAALDAAVDANVRSQCEYLVQESPVLKDFASSGRMRIVGGTYDLKSGKVKWLNHKSIAPEPARGER
jgi:carbonic anhydrase